jgi:uncharacterized membrane protein
MRASLQAFLRHAIYASRGGFLVRPLAIAIVLGCLGAGLSGLEDRFPGLADFIPYAAFASRSDPQVAQVILSDIATSIMTVVSIVFAILLMTLTLASMQFSPRILLSFVRDRVTQWTLGIFLGTFSYCMAALPAVRFSPHPFSPVVTVLGAMALALVCVGLLLFFIHHISQAISVGFIVDRIAGETEAVIDQIAPHPWTSSQSEGHPGSGDPGKEGAIANVVSGYVRFIDGAALLAASRTFTVRIRINRRVGQFAPAGVPLLFVSHPGRLDAEKMAKLRAAFDIGPTRTLEQDVEFGVLQIVDIALRAISPAVNDPSTAIGCIDQLSRLMIRWVGRAPPASLLCSPPHVVRVVLPWISREELLETAFDQIRHYSSSDVAVSLRLLRALGDIASVAPDAALGPILDDYGARIVEGCRAHLSKADLRRLDNRLAPLQGPAALANTAKRPLPATPFE